MQLNNRHIFLVHNITEEVQKYLSSHPSVETVKATPICYLKSMQNDGPVIALSCVIKATVSRCIILCFFPIPTLLQCLRLSLFLIIVFQEFCSSCFAEGSPFHLLVFSCNFELDD
jgi:hypothetical protein